MELCVPTAHVPDIRHPNSVTVTGVTAQSDERCVEEKRIDYGCCMKDEHAVSPCCIIWPAYVGCRQ